MDTDTIVPGEKSVTVVISRRVFPGRERDYDEWVRKLVEAATEAPGNAGATLLVPQPGKPGLYHVVLRFNNRDSVRTWEDSYVRQKLSHEADAFSVKSRQEATGLETWFSIPECPELAPPPQWKMFLITTFAAYILTLIIVPLEQHFLESWPFPVLNLLTASVLVGILTWVIMPWFSRHVFRRWLFK